MVMIEIEKSNAENTKNGTNLQAILDVPIIDHLKKAKIQLFKAPVNKITN